MSYSRKQMFGVVRQATISDPFDRFVRMSSPNGNNEPTQPLLCGTQYFIPASSS